jgi:hypothetical protein
MYTLTSACVRIEQSVKELQSVKKQQVVSVAATVAEVLKQLNPQSTNYGGNHKMGIGKSTLEAKSAQVESPATNNEKSSQAQSDDPSVKYMYTVLPNLPHEEQIKVGDLLFSYINVKET